MKEENDSTGRKEDSRGSEGGGKGVINTQQSHNTAMEGWEAKEKGGGRGGEETHTKALPSYSLSYIPSFI